MGTLYGERDSAFGQAVLTLRTAIGLTRAELSNRLGVSPRAVGEWEKGRSYPKVEHLKALIVLGVKNQAFPVGNEAEEIRTLWKVARQKVLLDEHWLSALLSGRRSPHLHLVPPHGTPHDTGLATVEETATPVMVDRDQTLHDPLPFPLPPPPGPRVDWGEALAVPLFYGREGEQAQLTQWVVQERCRIVSVLGMGGIGKSALAVSLMYRLSPLFEVVIFRSLRDAPSCDALLDDCLQVLSPQSREQAQGKKSVGTGLAPVRLPTLTPTEQRISLLLDHLRKARVLVVLDNLESMLSEGDVRGDFRPCFEGYGQLLRRVTETGHRSCLLLTSREKPAELRALEGRYSQVRSLRLVGLDSVACKQLFMDKGLAPGFASTLGAEKDAQRLIEVYGGNPLALKIVMETILDLFGGDIGEFLAGGTVIFGNITDLLDEQFARLSALEQSVLYWLAIMREPVTLDELLSVFVSPVFRVQLLEAVDALRRRSLIEPGKRPGSFTLQSVVLEYMTAVLIAQACHEIQQYRLDQLIQHGLELAHCKEYVRKTQERLLLSPLLVELQSAYCGHTSLEGQLLGLLDDLRTEADSAQGYGPANLIALWRVLRGHLRGLDLSHLSIRSAYLQGVEMQDTRLSGALIRGTALTEALDAIWGVAVSPKGTWWATGSRQGEVRVWNGESQTLRFAWQAYTDVVPTLAFSPNEHILAAGSWDCTVKLWHLDSGTLLWMGGHANIICVAFSPDGTMLASGGRDTTVKLWDTKTGTNVQMLQHPGYVYAVAWSPDGHLLATGGFNGCIRLWQIQKTTPAICIQTFWEHTNWVMGLAFAPDGRTLASGSWDYAIKLWDIASGLMLQTLSGHTDKVHRVAWSPNGRTLASCSVDSTIRLWDIDQDSWGRATASYRALLHGHTSAVYDLCFTPDSSRLLSGSEDGTLRVWEVESCRCVRVIQGYAVSLNDVDWSPDGTQLVSGGTDGLVTIWDAIGDTPPKVLHGHSWIVWGTAWSLDGKFLASSEHAAIHLWAPTSGACCSVLHDPAVSSMGLAWSPDGQLLAYGTLMHGVQVWDRRTGNLLWPPRIHASVVRHVSWSPDGTWLAAGGDEKCVYLWDAKDGILRRQLKGHCGLVNRVAWSPDSMLLASCGGSIGNGELFVWDVQSGQRVQTFEGHPGVVNVLAWSSSGDRLITGGRDGMLRWWDVQSGECVIMQKAHQGTVQALRISPDGERLASCGDDGAIMIWDLHSGEYLRRLRADRPYERLNITGIRGLTEAQKSSLQALGAIDDNSRPQGS